MKKTKKKLKNFGRPAFFLLPSDDNKKMPKNAEIQNYKIILAFMISNAIFTCFFL